MPEQNTPNPLDEGMDAVKEAAESAAQVADTAHTAPEASADAIAESENLLEELKKMVGDGASTSAHSVATTAEQAVDVVKDAVVDSEAPVAETQPEASVYPGGEAVAPSVAGETPAATPYPVADTATTNVAGEAPYAAELETSNLDAAKPKKKKTGLIVGLVVAALAIAGIIFAVTQMGSCSGVGDEGQIKAAVESAMSELAQPTEESKAELAEGISEGFEMTAGFNLEDLGITADEYADWVLGGITYEVGETQFDAEKGTGTAAVTVNSRDMASFNKNFEEEIVTMSNTGLGDVDSYEALYAKIGEAMRAAMEKTATAETQVTFDLTKGDDGWAVNDDSKEACYSQILAGSNV